MKSCYLVTLGSVEHGFPKADYGWGMVIVRISILLLMDKSLLENWLAIAVRVLLIAPATPFPLMMCGRSLG